MRSPYAFSSALHLTFSPYLTPLLPYNTPLCHFPSRPLTHLVPFSLPRLSSLLLPPPLPPFFLSYIIFFSSPALSLHVIFFPSFLSPHLIALLEPLPLSSRLLLSSPPLSCLLTFAALYTSPPLFYLPFAPPFISVCSSLFFQLSCCSPFLFPLCYHYSPPPLLSSRFVVFPFRRPCLISPSSLAPHTFSLVISTHTHLSSSTLLSHLLRCFFPPISSFSHLSPPFPMHQINSCVQRPFDLRLQSSDQ